MKARLILFALFVLIASLMLSTCTENGGSIYATIEKEQLVSTSTLSKTLVIADMTTVASGGPYYVAAGGVFQGALAGSTVTASSITWTPNSSNSARPYNPLGTDGTTMLNNALAVYSGSIYGGFYTPSGSQYGLYSATTAAPGTWSPLALPTTGEQVVKLLSANGFLLIAGTSGSYTSYEIDSWDGATMVQQRTGLTTKITGLAWDGTDFFFATTTAVYAALTPAGFAAATPLPLPALASGDVINSIYADTGHVFVVTQIGGLYYSSDHGATWTNVAAPVVNSLVVPLLTIAGPVGTSGVYLVGSDGYSYYTFKIGGSLTRFADTTIALYAESVGKILVDGTHVFMGTNEFGLWGAEFDGSATGGGLASGTSWIHE
jgi:hypothetical protein